MSKHDFTTKISIHLPSTIPFLKQRDAHGEQVASFEQSADGTDKSTD